MGLIVSVIGKGLRAQMAGMKTRVHITSSGRRPAPAGRPMARPAAPCFGLGRKPDRATCQLARPVRSLRREDDGCDGGELRSFGLPADPKGYRGPCEPYLTAFRSRLYAGCGGEIRTRDLVVMSHAGYRCPTPLKLTGTHASLPSSFSPRPRPATPGNRQDPRSGIARSAERYRRCDAGAAHADRQAAAARRDRKHSELRHMAVRTDQSCCRLGSGWKIE